MEERLTTDQAVAGSSPATDEFCVWKWAQQGIEPWTSRTRSENHATRPLSHTLREPQHPTASGKCVQRSQPVSDLPNAKAGVRPYPSGHGAGPEIQWALPAQVRTLPVADIFPTMQPWSSGMMEPSQGFDPGSIPGGCRLRGSMEERWTSD